MSKAKYNGLVHGHTGHLIAVSNNIDYLHGLAFERGLSQYEVVLGLKAIQQVTQLYNLDTAVTSNRYSIKQIKDKYKHWS